MNSPIKLVLYVVLVILACISGVFASRNFKAMMNRTPTRGLDEEENKAKTPVPATATNLETTIKSSDTNSIPSTNNVETNATITSNTTTEAATNAVTGAEVKENPADTVTKPEPKKEEEVQTALGGRGGKDSGKKGGIGLWTGVFVLSVIGIGILLALDISNFFGNRALKVIYNDEGEGIANPDYEAAENEWTKGNFLESIRMMRDYLNRNPREQYVALRIAEIYEKDLNNPLAAALEYEEVLTKKLKPERWGWAAIHLCNLYFHIGQEQKAFALLRRIVNEYPETQAAEKARKRLEQVDGATPVAKEPTEPSVRVVSTSKTPEPPASNLPPGFRPKK